MFYDWAIKSVTGGIEQGVIAVLVIAWSIGRRRPIVVGLFMYLLALLFGFAAEEGAAFHLGKHADQWGSLAWIVLVAILGLYIVSGRDRG